MMQNSANVFYKPIQLLWNIMYYMYILRTLDRSHTIRL